MPRCVAIVDDDEPVRTSTASLIRSLGLDAETFPSADDFLACDDRNFACVITDVQMPGTNGLELEQQIADWRNPLPVIIITAYPERARAAKAEGRIICWLEKPLNGDHLVSCLENAIGPLD